MKKSLLLTVSLILAVFMYGQPFTKLFISEYVEGSGNNKAIEIYNPSDQAIDLSEYQLVRYSNGGTTPNAVALGGTIAPNDTYVVVIDKRDPNGTGNEIMADPALQAKADTFLCPVYDVNKMMYFNGNDAVTLEKIGGTEILDIVTRVGNPDPENGWCAFTDTTITWNNGGVPEDYTIVDYMVGPLFWLSWTKNHTLIRKPDVTEGVISNPDVFNPSIEWDSLPNNSFDNLGFHAFVGVSWGISASDTSLCAGDQTIFVFDGAGITIDSLYWEFPNGNPSFSTEFEPQIEYNSPGDFDVYLTAYFSNDSSTINKQNYIHVNTIPSIPTKPAGDEQVCFSDDVSYYSTNATSLNWTITPSNAGSLNYSQNFCNLIWNEDFVGEASLKVQSINECGASAFSEELLITRNAEIIIGVEAIINVCKGEAKILDPEVSGGVQPYLYLWEPAYLFDNPNAETPTVTVYDEALIQLTLVDNLGCTNVSSITLAVEQFELSFSAFPMQFTSEPFNVQFDNQTPNLNDYNFIWYFGNGDSSQLAQPNYTYSSNGLYSVTLVAINKLTNCTDTLLVEDLITCTGASSLDELKHAGFSYHLNQKDQVLNINFQNQPKNATFQIFDLLGKEHLSKTISQRNFNISLKGYQPGMYLIVIHMNGKAHVGKIILRN